MNAIGKSYLDNTCMDPNNEGLQQVVDFLSQPSSVYKMIIASDMGLSAITPVVKELEEKYGSCTGFELNLDSSANASNRRTVGWIIKDIMSHFGYEPIEASDARRRLRKFSGNKYFLTGAIYIKTCEGVYHINTEIENN